MDQWQAALENCLTGKAQQLYWNLTVPEERGTYLLAKNAIVMYMGMPKARRLDPQGEMTKRKACCSDVGVEFVRCKCILRRGYQG